MPIPDELISNNIKNPPYYNDYLEMVAKYDLKMSAEKEGKKKTATRPLPVVEGKGKAIDTEEQVAQSLLALHTPKMRSIMDQFILQRQTSITEEASSGPSAQALDNTSTNIVYDSSSPPDAKTCARSGKKSSGDQGLVGLDPGRTLESQAPPEQEVMDEDQARTDPGESCGALAGPDPEPTYDEFMADLYIKVQESLKFSADEHVFIEDPISLTKTLSSMKNLEDAFTIGDQFITDKSTEDEPGKPNVEAKVVSMVTVPIYQASSSVPPLSTPIPVIDLLPPKHASSTTSTEGEFLAEKDMSRKRRRDDQDPPPPSSELDLSKRRRHDTDTSGSLQPQAPQSSAWKKSDTRDVPPSSSKQQSNPYAEQLVEDIPIPDSANISNSEDTDSAHLPKTKQRPEWFKSILDNDRPSTPEPAWVIPTSHIPDAANKWANAIASTYQAPAENSLLKFYIDRHIADSSCKLIRTHMRILSFVSIKAFSRFGYDYLNEITLRRANNREYTIAEKDFKSLYPSDFEDLNLLLLQVVFPIGNNKRKIMRFNDIYKFNDGTLTNIMEALDYRVKEYKVAQHEDRIVAWRSISSEEEGLDHHFVSCETCHFQQGTRPFMPVPWMPPVLYREQYVQELICRNQSQTSFDSFINLVRQVSKL
nr:hypothetical protein [Tanacetum cinerariifolium]